MSAQVYYDPKHPFRIKQTKHGMMAYSLNDKFIGRSLDQYGEWCEFEIDLLSRIIKPEDTVIDVGGNIGTHALAFSKMASHVYSFEPQPRLFRILAANIALNGVHNVTVKPQALGDSCETISIADLPPDETLFNFGALPLGADLANRITASMITIDSLGLAPSLIKIDVEGMEAQVIAGATETIKRCQPYLYLENNGNDSKAVSEALENVGYKAWWSMGPYFNPKNHFGNLINLWPKVMPSVNLIAVPRSSNVVFDLPEFGGAYDVWTKHTAALLTSN